MDIESRDRGSSITAGFCKKYVEITLKYMCSVKLV